MYENDCIESNECKKTSAYGLLCRNNSCLCRQDSYFDGSSCSKLYFKLNSFDKTWLVYVLKIAAKKSYKVTCSNSSECNEYQNLICFHDVCDCIENTSWNKGKCRK